MNKGNYKKQRTIFVIIFMLIFAILSGIFLRGNYLEYKELGNEYVQEFFFNSEIKYSIMLIIFLLLYTILYFTNRGIKKGLKEFFDK